MTVVHKFRSETTDYSLPDGAVLQNRYRVVCQLGRGGMGAVYEALDERLGITVALKETLSSEASMLKQFEHEARLLAGMHHPALPRVSDHFVEADRAFLVMQYIGGVDLAKIIAQQPGPFPRDQVIAWADQLLDALVYLHSRDRQVIHRDIKPHNLKLTSTGQIALLDFGLAKAQPADQSLTASRAFFGYTKHYAPLEQIQDQRTDQRSDIYALGATLYHLLTGIKPPDALVRATALINAEADPLKSAEQVHPAVGPQISAILNKAMSQRSENRFSTAVEFREALRRVGRTPAADFPKVQPPAERAFEIESTEEVCDSPFTTWPRSSAPRPFGPGTVMAILIVVASLATAVWFASPHLFTLAKRVERPAVPISAISERPTAAVRKIEKLRSSDGVGEVAVKARAGESLRDVKSETFDTKPPEMKKSRASSVLETSRRPVTPSEQRRRLSAPSIRFPKPEIAESSRLTSSKLGVRNHASSSDDPRFYREADGTLIVKFSDGSTRVIKPRRAP